MPSLSIREAEVTIKVRNKWEDEDHVLVVKLHNAAFNLVVEEGTWTSVTIDGDSVDSSNEEV